MFFSCSFSHHIIFIPKLIFLGRVAIVVVIVVIMVAAVLLLLLGSLFHTYPVVTLISTTKFFLCLPCVVLEDDTAGESRAGSSCVPGAFLGSPPARENI